MDALLKEDDLLSTALIQSICELFSFGDTEGKELIKSLLFNGENKRIFLFYQSTNEFALCPFELFFHKDFFIEMIPKNAIKSLYEILKLKNIKGFDVYMKEKYLDAIWFKKEIAEPTLLDGLLKDVVDIIFDVLTNFKVDGMDDNAVKKNIVNATKELKAEYQIECKDISEDDHKIMLEKLKDCYEKEGFFGKKIKVLSLGKNKTLKLVQEEGLGDKDIEGLCKELFPKIDIAELKKLIKASNSKVQEYVVDLHSLVKLIFLTPNTKDDSKEYLDIFNKVWILLDDSIMESALVEFGSPDNNGKKKPIFKRFSLDLPEPSKLLPDSAFKTEVVDFLSMSFFNSLKHFPQEMIPFIDFIEQLKRRLSLLLEEVSGNENACKLNIYVAVKKTMGIKGVLNLRKFNADLRTQMEKQHGKYDFVFNEIKGEIDEKKNCSVKIYLKLDNILFNPEKYALGDLDNLDEEGKKKGNDYWKKAISLIYHHGSNALRYYFNKNWIAFLGSLDPLHKEGVTSTNFKDAIYSKDYVNKRIAALNLTENHLLNNSKPMLTFGEIIWELELASQHKMRPLYEEEQQNIREGKLHRWDLTLLSNFIIGSNTSLKILKLHLNPEGKDISDLNQVKALRYLRNQKVMAHNPLAIITNETFELVTKQALEIYKQLGYTDSIFRPNYDDIYKIDEKIDFSINEYYDELYETFLRMKVPDGYSIKSVQPTNSVHESCRDTLSESTKNQFPYSINELIRQAPTNKNSIGISYQLEIKFPKSSKMHVKEKRKRIANLQFPHKQPILLINSSDGTSEAIDSDKQIELYIGNKYLQKEIRSNLGLSEKKHWCLGLEVFDFFDSKDLKLKHCVIRFNKSSENWELFNEGKIVLRRYLHKPETYNGSEIMCDDDDAISVDQKPTLILRNGDIIQIFCYIFTVTIDSLESMKSLLSTNKGLKDKK